MAALSTDWLRGIGSAFYGVPLIVNDELAPSEVKVTYLYDVACKVEADEQTVARIKSLIGDNQEEAS